jgi:hypothetical protein
MKKSANEIIQNLETRVAQLEKKSARKFSLSADYHYVFKRSYYAKSVERVDHSKVLFEGPKKKFIPQGWSYGVDEINSFVERDLIQEIGKIQKEIEEVFYASGVDPTELREDFEDSGNKFEWVLVAQGRAYEGEVLKLAYVRIKDKTYNFYVAPSIEIKVLNTKGRAVKANYILNTLASELGMRTVRIG